MLIDIYKKFPDKESCIKMIEKIKWGSRPVCPFCGSDKHSIIPKELRYHCNKCNSSYSVITNTVFNKTKCDLQKWLFAIQQVVDSNGKIGIRELSREINVNKNTAQRIVTQINLGMKTDREFLLDILNSNF